MNRVIELLEENHQILKSLRRTQRASRFFNILKWVVIIGSSFGLYYYFQDQIEAVVELNKKIWDIVGGAKGTINALNQALENIPRQ